MSGRQRLNRLETGGSAQDTDILQRAGQFGELVPKGHLTLHAFEEAACWDWLSHRLPHFGRLNLDRRTR